MRCNFETNNPNLAFGKLRTMGNVKQVLEKNLNPNEMNELKSLIEKQKNNPVTVTISNYTEDTLFGRVYCEETLEGSEHIRDLIQFKPFESYLSFVQRLCKKADYLHKCWSGYIKDIGHSEYDLKY